LAKTVIILQHIEKLIYKKKYKRLANASPALRAGKFV
jgi:hypothetical protein